MRPTKYNETTPPPLPRPPTAATETSISKKFPEYARHVGVGKAHGSQKRYTKSSSPAVSC